MRVKDLSSDARVCDHLGKMPRFITGDELGNLKAYTSTTLDGSTKVQCSELLIETNKQKSIQKLAIAKSTVRDTLREFMRKCTDTPKLKRRLHLLLLMEQFLCISWPMETISG